MFERETACKRRRGTQASPPPGQKRTRLSLSSKFAQSLFTSMLSGVHSPPQTSVSQERSVHTISQQKFDHHSLIGHNRTDTPGFTFSLNSFSTRIFLIPRPKTDCVPTGRECTLRGDTRELRNSSAKKIKLLRAQEGRERRGEPESAVVARKVHGVAYCGGGGERG